MKALQQRDHSVDDPSHGRLLGHALANGEPGLEGKVSDDDFHEAVIVAPG